jgi:hypothetical protein
VVDVTTTVEVDGGLELDLFGEVFLVLSLLECGQCGVEVGDVRLMVLLVMSLHDLTTDGRLQCTVVVRERRESVDSTSGG